MRTVELQRTIRQLVAPTIERLGLDLVAVEVTGDRRGRVLRLSVDKPDGVTISDCTEATWRLSPILEEEDPIAGKYHFEVSSPGLERPVQRVVDFERFSGLRVRVRLAEGHERRRVTGTIGEVVDGVVLIHTHDGEVAVDIQEVERAHLALDPSEWAGLRDRLAASEATAPPAKESDDDHQ